VTTFRSPLRFTADTLRLVARRLPLLVALVGAPRLTVDGLTRFAVWQGWYDPQLYETSRTGLHAEVVAPYVLGAITVILSVTAAGAAVRMLWAAGENVPCRVTDAVSWGARRVLRTAVAFAVIAAVIWPTGMAARQIPGVAGAVLLGVSVALITTMTVPLLSAAVLGPSGRWWWRTAVVHVRDDWAALLTRPLPVLCSVWLVLYAAALGVAWLNTVGVAVTTVIAVSAGWAFNILVSSAVYAAAALTHIDGAYLVDRRLRGHGRTAKLP
jgi:hypothetical protein